MKKGIKLACKILSVFLAVLLVIQIAPMQIIADAYHEATIDENTENTLGVNLDDIDTTESEAEILAEETSKREQYVKHFRMSDGSYRATQYEVPVHFMQDGEWTDYDNTLVEVDANTEDGESASNKDLTNTLADYSVRLSKKTNGKKFVRIEKDGYKLSWYYTKANKVTAQITEITDDGDETTLEKLSSQVVYKNVYKDTDFEYIIGSEGLKENIILNSDNTQTEFIAEYKANGLTPVQVNDKTIELQAEDGTVVYTINAPYMTDANMEYSDGITLTLSNIKNNKFTVTTTLDEDWLNDNDRVYPVIVDPVIKTEQIAADMASAFVGSLYPTRNYYTYGLSHNGADSGSMYVGNISGYGQTESYLKFSNLPTLGVADKVVNAVGFVYMYKCENGMQVDIKRITSSWTTETVTWKTKPTVAPTITDYKYISAGANNMAFNFEITDLVRGWYSGEYANYGVSFSTTKTSSAKVWMLNSLFNEGGRDDARPILYVDYRNMSGYEDYWSYTGLSAGRNGAVSVNNFNGNAVFSQPITMGDGGNLMPVALSLVYNSNGSNASYTFMGSKIKTNYHISMHVNNVANVEECYKYYMDDADGTRHWFYFEKDEDGNYPTSAKDEDGLGYTIYELADNPDSLCPNAKFKITDKDDNKMYFTAKGYLMQITDSNGNSAKITYENTDNGWRMKSIEDGAERFYTFNYADADNPILCTSITDPSGRVTSFTYTNNCMTAITFPDGKQITFNYGNYLIKKINHFDGTRAQIVYDSTSQRRVTNINWGTSDTNLLESYSFTYKQNETTITERVSAEESRTYTYQFNNFGQTTGIVSNEDGKAQYFDYTEPTEKDSPNANKLISQSKVIHSVTNYVVNSDVEDALSGTYSITKPSTATTSTVTLDTTKGNLTKNSIKVYKPADSTDYVYVYQNFTNLPAGTYTFSCYVNTYGITATGKGVHVGYRVLDTNGTITKNGATEPIMSTDGWERMSVTFDVANGETARILVGFSYGSLNGAGTAWFDDFQLEKSAGPSSYNLLDNSGFTNGKNDWSNSATLTTINDLAGFSKAISKVGSPTEQWLGLSQFVYPINGKKGDVFSIGSWIKADSAPINDLKKDDTYSPRFALALHFYNSSGTCIGTEELKVNDDLNTWQFVSGKVIAPADYSYCCFEVIYYSNVNTVMMTGGFCYREEFGQTYDYDENGNVASVVDISNSKSSFAFKGDQMAKMFNPSGSEYFYSYAYNESDLAEAVSTDGQRYSFTYDDKGNVTSSKIEADKPALTIEAGKHYIIRNAESGNVIDNGQTVGKVHNWRYRKGNTNQIWLVESAGETGVYYLKSIRENGFYMAVENNSTDNNASVISTSTAPSGNAYKFKIQSNGDGTFTILTKSSSYSKCVDGQPNDSKDYSDKVKILQCTKNTDDDSQRWYFYPDITTASGATQQDYIYTSATYTDNKNFVSTMTDQRGNVTAYNYDQNKGTLTSVTDAKNNTTSYVYNANTNALQSVTSGGMTNSYNYVNDRLTEIIVNGGTRYKFLYDAFGRTTATQVGNGTTYTNLSTLEYNNKGLLSKQTYGNQDYIEFEYDNLDRLVNKSYNGSNIDKVQYFYGADGNIARTTDYSTNTDTKYVYDLAGRLVSTRDYTNGTSEHLGLKSFVEYTYADKTNYLTGIKHFNALGTQNIGYRYGNMSNGEMPDVIYGVTWNGNNVLNYTYDSLGRLTNKSTPLTSENATVDNINTTYEYYDVDDTKTTTLLKSITTLDVPYVYEYDQLGNITSIGFNGGTPSTYEYDELNQLVRENSKVENKTYTYEYVNGNIKYKHQYDYTTGTLPATPRKSIEYHYNDSSWSDVLTGISEVTYTNSNTSTASAYSLNGATNESSETDTIEFDALAQSLLGNNYRKVDLTDNAVVNVGNDALVVPSTNTSTYSTNSVTTNSTTLYTFQSDEIGNITNVSGVVDLEWNGRRLESISQGGTEILSYDYNIDGQRTKKIVTDPTTGTTTTTEFFYNGSILAGQKTGDNVLIFMYDNNGDVFGFTYNGTPYYYVKNAQNDVFLILDETGTAVVLYQYDAWGKIGCFDVTEENISSVNPITYRSYYVDLEMGMFMYYLNSRYYMADWGRFISADTTDILSVQSDLYDKNLFAYCDNNPVVRVDVSGYAWETVFDIASLCLSMAEVAVNPADAWAWIGLAADFVDLVPFVTGLGEVVRAVKVSNKAIDAVDTVSDATKVAKRATSAGWKVGDDITNLTKAGKSPSWTTVKNRYWKNEAYYNPDLYLKSDLTRMSKGKPPQVTYIDGKVYSMELHHKIPRRDGGSNAYSNLLPVTPWGHAEIDPFRYFIS